MEGYPSHRLDGEHLTPEWIDRAKQELSQRGCHTEITYMDDEGGDDTLPMPQ